MAEIGEEKQAYRRVDEYSEEYESERMVRTVYSEKPHDRFGQALLNYIDDNAEVAGKSKHKISAKKQAAISREAENLKRQLGQFIQNPEKRRYVAEFFNENNIIDHGIKMPWEEKDFDNTDQVLEIKPQDIPNDTFITMLRCHNQILEEKSMKFERNELPLFLSEFKEGIRKLIGEGVLPSSVEKGLDRLHHTKIYMGDPLYTEFKEKYGFFSPQEEEISLAYLKHAGARKHVLFHELLHMLSGRTLLAKHNIKVDMPWDDYRIESQRAGLRLLSRFRWLNESVTEILTKKLMGEDDKDELDITNSIIYLARTSVGEIIESYGKEINLFDTLRTAGKHKISSRLFIDAYFENFDSSQPEGQRVPAWKRLIHAISDSYSPNFLIQLDKYIKSHGILEAEEAVLANQTLITNI